PFETAHEMLFRCFDVIETREVEEQIELTQVSEVLVEIRSHERQAFNVPELETPECQVLFSSIDASDFRTDTGEERSDVTVASTELEDSLSRQLIQRSDERRV